MSILDLHGDDLMAAASRYVNQPKPEPSSSSFSLNLTRGPQDMGGMRALVGGAGEAILQIAASASELAQAPGKRRELPGVDGSMTNDFSEVFRAAGRDLRPDAQTAHVAEQLMYQFARGATKIIGGAFAAGPAGIVAAGLEEANTQADELRRQGVDFETRAMAGGVQGAGLALAALPLVGTSLKATAGLYLAGGPGGFVAQQALTREILQGAGYEQIGAQFDPLDPVGLAVSALVPLPFVAAGVRGQRLAATARAAEDFRAGPVPSEMTGTAAAAREAFAPEVVDAARVAYAVERRAAGNPAPDAPRAADLHETALARAEEAMARGDAVQVADIFYHGTRGAFAEFSREKSGGLFNFTRNPETAEQYAVGLGGYRELADAFYVHADTGEVFSQNAGGDEWMGSQGTTYTARQLRDRIEFGDVIETREGANIRPVRLNVNPLDLLTSDGRAVLATLDDRGNVEARSIIADAAKGRFNWISTKHEASTRVWERVLSPQLEAKGYTGIKFKDDDFDQFTIAVFRPEQIRSAFGDGGRVNPITNLADALAQVRRAANPEPATRAPEATTPANPEAATPARGPGAAATEPSLPKPGAEPDAAQAAGVAARLAQIEAEFPDLMVQMDGDAAPRPLSQFLADAQREADEMAADAPLVQALAECSLLNGFN
jgi:hypothetical protein